MPDLKDRFRRLRELGPDAVANAALGTFCVIAAAVTVTAIVESYANLAYFAWTHQMTAWHGAIAPVAVDSFIALGELLLFAALIKRWSGWGTYAFAAVLTVAGFALSAGGNIWHAAAATFTDRAVQAIWPVTATAALTGILIIIKRTVNERDGSLVSDEPAPAAPPAPGLATREPVPRRETRAPGLAVVTDEAVRALARELTATAKPWPSDRKLGESKGMSRRKAAQALELAAAMSNGNRHVDAGSA